MPVQQDNRRALLVTTPTVVQESVRLLQQFPLLSVILDERGVRVGLLLLILQVVVVVLAHK